TDSPAWILNVTPRNACTGAGPPSPYVLTSPYAAMTGFCAGGTGGSPMPRSVCIDIKSRSLRLLSGDNAVAGFQIAVEQLKAVSVIGAELHRTRAKLTVRARDVHRSAHRSFFELLGRRGRI